MSREELGSSVSSSSGDSAARSMRLKVPPPRVRSVAEEVRVDIEKKIRKRKVKPAPLSRVLRAGLYTRRRCFLVERDDLEFEDEFARDHVFGRCFDFYCGKDRKFGLSNWMSFVQDALCTKEKAILAVAVFHEVALETATATFREDDIMETHTMPHLSIAKTYIEALEAIVNYGVHDMRLDSSKFLVLVKHLAFALLLEPEEFDEEKMDKDIPRVKNPNKENEKKTPLLALQKFAHRYMIPLLAAMPIDIDQEEDDFFSRTEPTPPEVIQLLLDYFANLWHLFVMYAHDQHKKWPDPETFIVSPAGFPECAQAAEHVVAGSKLEEIEFFAEAFAPKHKVLKKHIPEAVKAFKMAVLEEKKKKPPKYSFPPGDGCVTTNLSISAVRFNDFLEDIAITPDFASHELVQKAFRLVRSYRLAAGTDIDKECGISFCEFIEAMVYVVDHALKEQRVFKKMYPTLYLRVVAFISIWGAGDIDILRELRYLAYNQQYMFS